MYFVDRSLILKRLEYMENLQREFRKHGGWGQPLKKLALERIAIGWLEAMIDVGNQMIDGFIMRDPGSYNDIVDILEDESVITKGDADQLKSLVAWRKILVSDYLAIDHPKLAEVLEINGKAMQTFPSAVKSYLEKELGPVSAFLPEKE